MKFFVIRIGAFLLTIFPVLALKAQRLRQGTKMSLFFIICLFAKQPLVAQQAPRYSYLKTFNFTDTNSFKLKGSARVVDIDGRKGLNMTSIKSVLELKAHNMKQNRGTVTLWMLSLEELSTSLGYSNMSLHNPNWRIYPILSDYPDPQNFNKASFKMVWMNAWHPNLVALFGKDKFYESAFYNPHKALISVSHFTIPKRVWYQYALTWDYDKDQYRLYVNGVQVGIEDQFKKHKPHRDSINTSLYIGSPTLCYSDIKFYDTAFSSKEVYSSFRKEVTRFDQHLEDELMTTYAGKSSKPFTWKMGAGWKPKLMLSLNKPTDLDSFYVQGNPVKVGITKDGLLMETVNREANPALVDSQMYIWTKKPFEGDLYVEYEYKSLRPGGLSLLLTQASGMNREDFMADYPLRTSGRMTMIYGEDVRSYHWEYYREHADMRNDLDNSAIMKEPYNYPLAFRSRNAPLAKDTWHKLQFLQQGNKITGAIDGVIMFEVTDNASINNGPILDFGRIAIRIMMRSKMMFRNLKVYNNNGIKAERVPTVNN